MEIKQSKAPCFPTERDALIGSWGSNQEVNLIGWWIAATQATRVSRFGSKQRRVAHAKWSDVVIQQL